MLILKGRVRTNWRHTGVQNVDPVGLSAGESPVIPAPASSCSLRGSTPTGMLPRSGRGCATQRFRAPQISHANSAVSLAGPSIQAPGSAYSGAGYLSLALGAELT